MKCLLCEREGTLRTYVDPETLEEIEVPLCRFHYACYMAHGIKKLDEKVKGLKGESR